MKPPETGQDLEPQPAAGSGTEGGGFRSEIKSHRWQYALLGGVCLAVIGLWVWSITSGGLDYEDSLSGKSFYNLLVEGFRNGQLNVKLDAPPGLARLANPYDPVANLSDCWILGRSLVDLSYYHGKLYLYFGATPALVLYWPCAVLTGHELSNNAAGLFFCSLGFLTAAGMLYALWRRCFAEVGFGVMLAGAAALGLATGLPVLLARCNANEVAISCGYAFVMLALALLWGALVSPQRQGWWLAGASLAYGLAVGARPNLLFGAGMLLIPVARAWWRRQRAGVLLAAAAGPIAMVGAGLAAYNVLRFGNALEFGQTYMLGTNHQIVQQFSPRYLRFDFWAYFLEPLRWSHSYPYVRQITTLAAPPGLAGIELPLSILTGVPLVWLALAAGLVWRSRPEGVDSDRRGMLAGIGWVAATAALPICAYYWVADRYELDFLPALGLLAVAGIFELERALRGRPRWRALARCGWVLLLVWSAGFNELHAFERRALADTDRGTALQNLGRLDEAIGQFQEAIRYEPDYTPALNSLSFALAAKGRTAEAIRQYQENIRIHPDDIDAYINLGDILVKLGQMDEAIRLYSEALRLQPDNGDLCYNLGTVLFAEGRRDEAISQLQEAVRLQPGNPETHRALGLSLAAQGRVDEAIPQYQEAIRLKPDYAEADNNLGAALAAKGRLEEAIGRFQEAVRLKPDYAEARNNLDRALKMTGAPAGR